MSSEAINASALGAAGIGMPGLMWAADKLHYDVPPWLAELVLGASVICILVSVILWLHLLSQRIGLPSWPIFDRHIPFDDAARRVYEAAEKADALDVMISVQSRAEDKLNTFKMLLLVDGRVRLYGAKPPSTQSRLIPKEDLRRELYPSDKTHNALDHLIPADHPAAFVNVTVPRTDLRNIIKIYLTEYVDEAKQMRRGQWPR